MGRDTHSVCSTLLVLIAFLSVGVYASQVSYSVQEEDQVGTIVGNIGDDIKIKDHLSPSNLKTVDYLIVSQCPTTKDQLFALNKTSGTLTIASKINRKVACSCAITCKVTLTVVVRNIRGFFAIVTVLITTDTINRFSPYFEENVIAVNVSEQASIGFKIPIKGAIDNDCDGNSVQSYEILPSNGTFHLQTTKDLAGDVQLNLLVRRVLDRETMDRHQLLLIAKDGGTPQRSGSVSIQVTVEDVNDNAPMFTQYTHYVNISENAAPAYVIVNLSASDRDLGENGKVQYRLVPRNKTDDGEGLLSLDTKGNLYVKGNWSYIPGHVYKVYVEAFDNGNPQRKSQAVVNIAVKKVRNNPPKIQVHLLSQKGFAEVSEHAQPGLVIGLIKVVDTDPGSNGIVTCNTSSQVFELNHLQGNEFTLTLVRHLDRESMDSYNFRVTCNDMGSPRITRYSHVYVHVTDENDNRPIFIKEIFSGSISENNDVGDTILQVRARDADIGPNGKVTYALHHANIKRIFLINPTTGMVTANTVFDEMRAYIFRVVAYDDGQPRMTGAATVRITVEAKTDNGSLIEC